MPGKIKSTTVPILPRGKVKKRVAKKAVKKDRATGYDAFKEFEGKRYTE